MTKYLHLIGKYLNYRGESPNFVVVENEVERPATPEEKRQIEIEEYAERIVEREILACQSSLVDMLMRHDPPIDGFTWDEVHNLYVDPSEWIIQECKEWIDDRINLSDDKYPDPNPYGMTREEMIEYLNLKEAPFVPDNVLRQDVILNINENDDLDSWRDFVCDNDGGQEVLEWWLVSSWLAKELDSIGEPILDNDFSTWWGRTCSGQAIIADGVMQRIAVKYVK